MWPGLYMLRLLPSLSLMPKSLNGLNRMQITELKSKDSDPDNAIDKYADKIAFAGRDYAKNPNGTAEIIRNLRPKKQRSITTKF
jgi:zinc protease